MTGWVDENDLAIAGGWPGRLREVFGIWAEEIDALFPDEANSVVVSHPFGELAGSYRASLLCELIHVEADSTQVLGVYGDDFYKGRPALTVNAFGEGAAYYIASRNDESFHRAFYRTLADQLKLPRVLACELPVGVTARSRRDDGSEFVFIMNFTSQPKSVVITGSSWTDAMSGDAVAGPLEMHGYGARVLQRAIS
jgi:beta-galactosidase